MAAKKKPVLYTFDRKTKRWRKNGKYSQAPKKSELRKDKLGRPLDATGKLVPLASLATTKKAPKKRPAKAKKKPAKAKKKAPKRKRGYGELDEQYTNLTIPLRDAPKPSKIRPRRPKRSKVRPKNFEMVPDGSPITEKALISSVFQNESPPELAHEAFIRLINRKAYKAQMPTDDVLLYQFGVQFINPASTGDLTSMAMLVHELAATYPELTFKFGEDSLHVMAGDKEIPISVDSTATIMGQLSSIYTDIWHLLRDMWDGDIGWFIVAENDFLQGGS